MQKIITVIAIVALMSPLLSGQQPPPAPPPAIPEVRVYDLTWRSAEDIAGILRSFVSDTRHVQVNQSFNTLTVKASNAGHMLIAELIEKYDVEAKTIVFQFYILRALQSGEGLKNGVPDPVRSVLREVAGLTRYQHFELMDAPILRTTESKRSSITGRGAFSYDIRIENPSIVRQQDPVEIRVDQFAINFQVLTGYTNGDVVLRPEQLPAQEKLMVKPVYERAGIQTSFNIADGETLVLGASQIQEKANETDSALITVVTADVLN